MATLLLIGWLPLDSLHAVGLWLATLALAVDAERRHFGPDSVTALRWGRSDWQLRTRCGRELAARLLEPFFLSPGLTILRFRVAGEWRRRSVLLRPGPADAEALRRLRVRLRLEGLSAPEEALEP